ncbi:MAG: enoyl-CoA hydratase/isomerase family protein [Rhodoferax sp.]|nr:enoyl-CoA hydratase/isomerase family protein [Rhodoferax sp.]
MCGVDNFQTIRVSDVGVLFSITLNREKEKNGINRVMLDEIAQAIRKAEESTQCKIILIEGHKGFFSYGMDLEEVVEGKSTILDRDKNGGVGFFQILRSLIQSSKLVVSVIDGRALGGAVGLIAASDIAISTQRSVFSLPEIRHGLIAANVSPFLIRKIGFAKTYKMALSAAILRANEAQQIGLIDSICDDTRMAVAGIVEKFSFIDSDAIKRNKAYFNKLHPVNAHEENIAFLAIQSCLHDELVIERIRKNQQGVF